MKTTKKSPEELQTISWNQKIIVKYAISEQDLREEMKTIVRLNMPYKIDRCPVQHNMVEISITCNGLRDAAKVYENSKIVTA